MRHGYVSYGQQVVDRIIWSLGGCLVGYILCGLMFVLGCMPELPDDPPPPPPVGGLTFTVCDLIQGNYEISLNDTLFCAILVGEDGVLQVEVGYPESVRIERVE